VGRRSTRGSLGTAAGHRPGVESQWLLLALIGFHWLLAGVHRLFCSAFTASPSPVGPAIALGWFGDRGFHRRRKTAGKTT
jgi:hypothetical protein